MTKRTVVIRKKTYCWQPKTKRKTEQVILAPKNHSAGFISPVFVVLACTLFSGLFYIYSVNQTAVKGIAIRSAEQEIVKQKKENEILKIREAELKSLYNIEESSKQLNMAQSANIKYLEESPSVAYGNVIR
ncbi:MAG: hypothetical protein US25_C0071G0004 [Candidatus Moranbacteria bacterium GW2011_GWE1_36_7]|nr:MAG: hypothetical protein UR99_C0029G0004 [Candidatus Moranbacteria bacterium GW2011_GWD2_36_12]KKQ05971.1 MAG: hypothetical protein US16_C0029G0004 [Candidatus Moranbacteria bacterium GW2011_GWE2_36_40]KKQ11849.1 MAG: hypothetical protein US25_C0071G0004 [Candidatus Moranbacteria bacterium GW2011_GWE1_36_7]